MHPPSTEDFRKALQKKFEKAQNEGLSIIDVRAGDLHNELGYYNSPYHRMPACCNAMYSMMDDEDIILKAPPKGRGANLVIRYHLPRKEIVTTFSQLNNIVRKRPPDDMIIRELIEIDKKHPNLVDIKSLQTMMSIKPESAIIEARKVAEQVAVEICKRQRIPVEGLNFNDLCGVLKNKKILDSKILSYLNTLRIIGNIAAHKPSVTFSTKEAMIIGYLLAEYLNYTLDHNLI